MAETLISGSLGINSLGHLTIGGADAVALADKYGTPLYVMDENTIRERMRLYNKAHADFAPNGGGILFASKACCFKRMYEFAKEENIYGADAVSPGEIMTARAAGYPMEKLYFHGNNKTDRDIILAMELGVGTIVADSREELEAISSLRKKLGMTAPQHILLRITPGVDPHTHQKITTGTVDSKFGTPISTGAAYDIVKYALSLPGIALDGFHCHIGSQIFESTPFINAAEIMIDFIAEVKSRFGYEAEKLDIGGGFGVRYTHADPVFDYRKGVGDVCRAITDRCAVHGIKVPVIALEPGRSIVADSAITLYTVGSVKHIEGFRSYVSIDGGMTDNPRYALYQSRYEILRADKAGEEKTLVCTLAGRCCESGDLIGENLAVQPVSRGDIIAVLVTGAYNYSMASNYNRLPRPAVVMIRNGEHYVAVRRESYDDLLRLDI